jgi:tRNA (cmo5U34)-methyltransferase
LGIDTATPGMEAGQGIDTTRSNWVFDEKVAQHFDEHVRKSVPDYDRIQDLAASFADWFVQDGGTVIDLGASTGETLLRIRSRKAPRPPVHRGVTGSCPQC